MVDVKKLLWKNDRNFNKDEINDQRYFLVAEHNDLITKARHDLNARELKIMDYVISKIKPDDKNFNVIQTSMYELSNVLELKRSGRTYSQLA
ncbi:replication initiator protein, partial [Lacticaseibacillus rhamnosus]